MIQRNGRLLRFDACWGGGAVDWRSAGATRRPRWIPLLPYSRRVVFAGRAITSGDHTGGCLPNQSCRRLRLHFTASPATGLKRPARLPPSASHRAGFRASQVRENRALAVQKRGAVQSRGREKVEFQRPRARINIGRCTSGTCVGGDSPTRVHSGCCSLCRWRADEELPRHQAGVLPEAYHGKRGWQAYGPREARLTGRPGPLAPATQNMPSQPSMGLETCRSVAELGSSVHQVCQFH